jgi:hypothetical protein
VRKAPTICLLALGLAVPATAVGGRPIVPTSVQAKIKATAPALAYVPTRLAIGFHYRRWAFEQGVVRIWFSSKAGWEIAFVAAALNGNCRARMEKSFQLAGNKVYWGHTEAEQQAWRCVKGPTGRVVRLVASSPQAPSKFADVGLGRIVASAKRA